MRFSNDNSCKFHRLNVHLYGNKQCLYRLKHAILTILTQIRTNESQTSK